MGTRRSSLRSPVPPCRRTGCRSSATWRCSRWSSMRIELATGQVWPDAAFGDRSVLGEQEEHELEGPDKWLWVRCEGYRNMEWFIETVTGPDRAGRLEIAIAGRGV